MLAQLSAEIRNEWGEPEMRLVAKSVSPHYKSITLASTSHRCRLAGREHASNHISFRVSLVTLRFYQVRGWAHAFHVTFMCACTRDSRDWFINVF